MLLLTIHSTHATQRDSCCITSQYWAGCWIIWPRDVCQPL